jgi:PKHD-type hydroxylase
MNPNYPLGVFRLFPSFADNELVDQIRDLSRKYHKSDAETYGTTAIKQQIGADLFAKYDTIYKEPHLNDSSVEWNPTSEQENTFYQLLHGVEERAGVRDGGNTDLDYRQCDRWPVPIEYEPWLCDMTRHLAMISNNQWGLDLHYINQAELLRYRGQGDARGDHYDWHSDADLFPDYNTPQQYVDCPKFQRKLTIIIQLAGSEEYVGGDLQIASRNGGNLLEGYEEVARQLGTVIVFPSYLEHRITPVESGERMSIVLWMNGKAIS